MREAAELGAALEGYIAGVRSGELVVGKLERHAVERHVRDLKHGAERGLRFNLVVGLFACQWIEAHCRFSKGKWGNTPFILQPWQIFFVANLFGWQSNATGKWLRRFRYVYCSMARKNGKSELAAAVGLLYMFVFNERRGEIVTAATKRDQALFVWEAAAEMLRVSPKLKAQVTIRGGTYNILHRKSKTTFQALSSDARKLDGIGTLLGIIDEYHAHPSRDVFDVLDSGKGSREEPCIFVITTAGERRSGACWEAEDDAIKILQQHYGDDSRGDDVFAFICRIDETDDPFDEACWRKANPNLGISVYVHDMRSAARLARRIPSNLAEFRRKRTNEWTESSITFIPMAVWDRNTKPLRKFARRECVIGLDLSSTSDYTAAAPVLAGRDGTFDVEAQFWIPQEKLFERRDTGRPPIIQWSKQKTISSDPSTTDRKWPLIITTPGERVDHNAVLDWFLEFRKLARVKAVVMDPAQGVGLSNDLSRYTTVVDYQPNFPKMSPAVEMLERMAFENRIRHGANPVARWQVGNTAVVTDHNERRNFDKKRSSDRIDWVWAVSVALLYAVSGVRRSIRPGAFYRG